MQNIQMTEIVRAAKDGRTISSKHAMLRVEFAGAARLNGVAHGLTVALVRSFDHLEAVFNCVGGGKLDTQEPDYGVYVDLSLETAPEDFDTWFNENHQILGASLMANGASGMRTASQYMPLKLNLQPINPPLPL